MQSRDEILWLIKYHNQSLQELGSLIVNKCAKALYANDKTSIFLTALGSCILSFSYSLRKSMDEGKLDKTSYEEIKEKYVKYYLDVNNMMIDAEPRLKRHFSTALYDYTIFVVRSFFRIFDLLFTFLSCAEKTMAQQADESIREKYTFLASNTDELTKRFDSAYRYNYSRELQFFQLDSRAYQKEINDKFHYTLSVRVIAIDKLVSQLFNGPQLT